MRLWTVHPKYLDAAGLVALWREALLARAVLRGTTRGYRHHPQLARFRAQPDPVACLDRYLAGVFVEARRRGYRFDPAKFARAPTVRRIPETSGQLAAEWAHLLRKLGRRDAERYGRLAAVVHPAAHPLFRIVPGPARDWDRSAALAPAAPARRPG
ncbi:MAG TPA: pyrimidine dimer DNA glycosylase/endonuclease V [Gemmatimonadales bacterium]|nr:pyrimidine dimer DNA glycosylase/endonuclease V [Gemmatimonadales bacterium]